MTRLRRWREREGVEAETLARLSGIELSEFVTIEAGANKNLPPEDAFAIKILFDDALTIGQLLASHVEADEESRLDSMTSKYVRTLARWR